MGRDRVGARKGTLEARKLGRANDVSLRWISRQYAESLGRGDQSADAIQGRMLSGSPIDADPVEAARAGHHLAGVVVCHPGAIIPRAAMPSGIIGKPTTSYKATP